LDFVSFGIPFFTKTFIMEPSNLPPTDRRSFLGTLATGAAAISLGGLAVPLQSMARSEQSPSPFEEDPDAWFDQIKGKHRIVFDVIEPAGVFPFAWPRVFLLTNAATGTPENESNVVVVLRHEAIPYAMNNTAWSKYNLGKFFKITDDKTKESALRNAFYKPAAGDFQIPGVGPVAIGINELQESGVMFCVCNMALTVYGAAVAQSMNMDPKEVYNDFKAAVLPGIQIVPSGVWAIGRAQEHKCAYCRT
jgi:intracellular sulfur oxidation DsrE/DsrF family protein